MCGVGRYCNSIFLKCRKLPVHASAWKPVWNSKTWQTLLDLILVQDQVTSLSHSDPIISMFTSSDLWTNKQTEKEGKRENIYHAALTVSRKMSKINLLTRPFKKEKKERTLISLCLANGLFVQQGLTLKKITLTFGKYCYFSLMGEIGLPRLRSVVFRTGMEIGLTPLCTLTIGFRQGTSCLFNPTAPCTPSHALHTH